jgi:hypothetical protein
MKLKEFRSPDGTSWRVGVRSPSSSTAMVVFYHPAGGTSRRDRYAWHNSHAPEARSVVSRLRPEAVLETLTDRDLALLYRRSMPISTPIPAREPG